MMDNLTGTQRKIVVGVVCATGAAVIVTVVVLAALLLRRRIRDKKRTRARSHELAYNRKRFNSVGSGTQTPPGTAYHSTSFANVGNGPSIVDLRTKRPSHVPDPGEPAGRGLPLPRGPTPLVDIPYRDTRLPSSQVHYTFDGRVHLPENPVRETKISRYGREVYQGASRYPFHKRDSYEYGRYMPSSYDGRSNSDDGSKSSGRNPAMMGDLSRPGFQEGYTGYEKWPSWSRDHTDAFSSNDPRGVHRNSRSDTSPSSHGEWTDMEDNVSNTDSRPFKIPRARLSEPD